jgi:3-oxoacyl-[acyl-carrier protein] reductase
VNHLVVTGGGGGLAQAIVSAFTSVEWEIATPNHVELDVTESSAVTRFFESRTVDLLVCAAGAIRDGRLLSLDESTWDEILAVNYQGAAACACAALPRMIERGIGHIVFISSYSAIHPPLGQAAYATAKAALLGLTESLAQKAGTQGIRVNAILPGFLETGMTQSVSPQRKAEILASHSLGCLNTPSAVGGFIRYLHESLPHTSGQTFQLDSRRP